jgi:hypothetical protein
MATEAPVVESAKRLAPMPAAARAFLIEVIRVSSLKGLNCKRNASENDELREKALKLARGHGA